jgi:hypothetical protein
MAFFECEFPKTISYRSVGGPSFFTIVNRGANPQETRLKNWNLSLGKWQVSLMTPGATSMPAGVTRQGFIDLIHSFFLNVGGKYDAFRLKDHRDFFWNTPQTLGVGNGVITQFQLTKAYGVGTRGYARNISKPVWPTGGAGGIVSITDYVGNPLASTVTIALNGVPTGAFTLDGTTGIVTMNSAPSGGVVVTSPSGQFHYPVRFDTDEFPMQLDESDVLDSNGIISVNAIDLVEVLCPNY